MEKPAIIMNETAFKMLIEALTGKQVGSDDEGVASSEVEKFIKGWQQSEMDKPTGRPSARDFEAEFIAAKQIMLGKGPMQLQHIWADMNDRGLWPDDKKSATNYMRDLMKRYPDIEKIGRGLYQLPGPNDIVLKFKDMGDDDE